MPELTLYLILLMLAVDYVVQLEACREDTLPPTIGQKVQMRFGARGCESNRLQLDLIQRPHTPFGWET